MHSARTRRVDLEGITDPRRWAQLAIEEGLGAWRRCGERYAARLVAQAQLRDPLEDVLTLAARRVLPLPRRVLRPLPRGATGASVEAPAAAFARLATADRRVLLRWRGGAVAGGAAAEHLAAALLRFAEAVLEVQGEVHENVAG